MTFLYLKPLTFWLADSPEEYSSCSTNTLVSSSLWWSRERRGALSGTKRWAPTICSCIFSFPLILLLYLLLPPWFCSCIFSFPLIVLLLPPQVTTYSVSDGPTVLGHVYLDPYLREDKAYQVSLQVRSRDTSSPGWRQGVVHPHQVCQWCGRGPGELLSSLRSPETSFPAPWSSGYGPGSS